MKENRKLLKEVIKGIKRDMTDEDVLNLLADSKVSENPNREKDKYTFGQRAADAIAKFAGSWAFIFSFAGLLILWMLANVLLAVKAFDPYPFILLNLALSCASKERWSPNINCTLSGFSSCFNFLAYAPIPNLEEASVCVHP